MPGEIRTTRFMNIKLRFEEVYAGWNESRLSQEEAARVLGVSDRTFRDTLIDRKRRDWKVCRTRG